MVVLAASHHDADLRLLPLLAARLPALQRYYAQIVVVATPTTPPEALAPLHAAGAIALSGPPELPVGHVHLGAWRRLTVATALEALPAAQHIHFCDLDRVLFWVEHAPEELGQVLAELAEADFTVFGRTAAAFASHPLPQRETEAQINRVFSQVSGRAWDTGGASRGLSRQAAEHLVANRVDDSVGSDCSWPLALLRAGGFVVRERRCDGLAYETAERFGDQIAAAGSYQAWLAALEANPHEWVLRLAIAHASAAAALAWGREP